MNYRRWMGVLVIAPALMGTGWALRAPGWAPLSALAGLPPTKADLRCVTADLINSRSCGWGERDRWEEHAVVLQEPDDRVLRVKHVWRMSDSVQWRKTRDSLTDMILRLRPSEPSCERLAKRLPSTREARRWVMRGYAVELYGAYFPPNGSGGSLPAPPWHLELWGGTELLPCKPAPLKARRMMWREMREATERRVVDWLSTW